MAKNGFYHRSPFCVSESFPLELQSESPGLLSETFQHCVNASLHLIWFSCDPWTLCTVASAPPPHRSRPVACSYPPFQITFLAFPPFLFLISSSFCCICPFVTSWRYRLLHQQGESFVCACVCVWSRSLKRWSFDVGLHSCVHTVLAEKKNPAAS